MRECRFCKELIREDAIVCKYCKRRQRVVFEFLYDHIGCTTMILVLLCLMVCLAMAANS